MTRKSRREIEREIRDLATNGDGDDLDPANIDMDSDVVTITSTEEEPPEPEGEILPTESDVVTVYKLPTESADVEE